MNIFKNRMAKMVMGETLPNDPLAIGQAEIGNTLIVGDKEKIDI